VLWNPISPRYFSVGLREGVVHSREEGVVRSRKE
jgi:hypothetical protein